jgi:hypothetical protein
MNLSIVAELIWATSFAGHVALLAVLLIRRRWREFPVFTGYIAFHAIETPILYVLFLVHSSALYANVYWTCALVDFAFQIGIVFEVARNVMKPTGTWLRDARKQFLLGGSAGLLLAAGLTWWLTPPGVHGPARLEMKGNLFAAFLICELFLIISSTARKLGLGWRNHVLAITQGFGAWVVVSLLTGALQSYFGHSSYFAPLNYAHQFVSVGVLAYWITQMWREEPIRQPISDELQQYIIALHNSVEYDLTKLRN